MALRRPVRQTQADRLTPEGKGRTKRNAPDERIIAGRYRKRVKGTESGAGLHYPCSTPSPQARFWSALRAATKGAVLSPRGTKAIHQKERNNGPTPDRLDGDNASACHCVPDAYGLARAICTGKPQKKALSPVPGKGGAMREGRKHGTT